MRYEVWYGYAIKQFGNRQAAIDFAYENDGVLIDTWSEHGIIELPLSTPISYWIGGDTYYVEVTPGEVNEYLSQGLKIDLRVGPK